MKKIFDMLEKKGLLGFLFLSVGTIWNRVFSTLHILFFRLCDYKIDYSVFISKDVIFFQSNKNSVVIGANSFIGNGVRIKAGFDGKILIGKKVYIHDYSFIFAHEILSIGDNTLISPNVFITDFDHKFPQSEYGNSLSSVNGYTSKKVTIGKNVWIGAGSVILPGITIGEDAVIGAGSVVTKNIPSFSVAIGNPARVVKKIKR